MSSQISPITSRPGEDGRRISSGAILALVAVLLPAVAGYAVLYHQGLAVPYQDDFHSILAFGTGYVDQPELAAKAAYLIKFQHNEYKLIFAHLVAACEISFTGHLNFAFLNTLGDLFLLPLSYLLWLIYRKKDESAGKALIRFVPLSLIFFSLTYWETLNWAMASLSNIPVIFFSFLAVYLLEKAPAMRKPWVGIALACVSGLAAAFSLVNGVLLAPVGLLILLPKRAFKAAAAWCVVFVVGAVPYFYHYTHIARPVLQMASLRRAVGLLTFFGSALPSLLPALLLGLALLAIGASAVRTRFHRNNPAAFYSFVWILLTGLVVAWGRGASGGTLWPRYSIYSLLTVIFCLAFLADILPVRFARFNAKWFYAAVTTCALVFCIWADAHAYRKLGERKEMVLNGLEHYRADPAVNSPLIDPLTISLIKGEEASERMDLTHALEKRIYILPEER